MLLTHCPPIICTIYLLNDPPTTELYTLSLHDALPISAACPMSARSSRWLSCSRSTSRSGSPTTTSPCLSSPAAAASRSEEHTSELQSRRDLVCRLLLEKKKEV